MTTHGTSKELELLPCPFCGGEAEFEHIHNNQAAPHEWSWSVGCKLKFIDDGKDDDDSCYGYQSLHTYARKVDAAKAWNKRPTPEPEALPAVARYDLMNTSHGYEAYMEMVREDCGDWVRWDDIAPHLRSAQPPCPATWQPVVGGGIVPCTLRAGHEGKHLAPEPFSAQPPSPEWRPIETVPKDGSEVALLFEREQEVLCSVKPRVRAAAWANGDWGIPYYRDNPPIGWKPLPSSPTK